MELGGQELAPNSTHIVHNQATFHFANLELRMKEERKLVKKDNVTTNHNIEETEIQYHTFTRTYRHTTATKESIMSSQATSISSAVLKMFFSVRVNLNWISSS
jgi:hypothetical protein